MVNFNPNKKIWQKDYLKTVPKYNSCAIFTPEMRAHPQSTKFYQNDSKYHFSASFNLQ